MKDMLEIHVYVCMVHVCACGSGLKCEARDQYKLQGWKVFTQNPALSGHYWLVMGGINLKNELIKGKAYLIAEER